MNSNTTQKVLRGIGANIRYLRELRGLTLKQLADKTATVNYDQIYRIEEGANHELSTLIQIAEALDAPLSLLVMTRNNKFAR